MGRLTKTYEDGSFGVADKLPCGENSYAFKDLLIKKLGRYEELEEQGRLIELPCKVGEKIYRPINNHIIEFIVIGLIYDIIKDRWSYETVYQSGTDWRKGVCDFGLIGEIVFLTKEEAEAKLKRNEKFGVKKEKDINIRDKTFITALGKYYFEKYIKPQLEAEAKKGGGTDG